MNLEKLITRFNALPTWAKIALTVAVLWPLLQWLEDINTALIYKD